MAKELKVGPNEFLWWTMGVLKYKRKQHFCEWLIGGGMESSEEGDWESDWKRNALNWIRVKITQSDSEKKLRGG